VSAPGFHIAGTARVPHCRHCHHLDCADCAAGLRHTLLAEQAPSCVALSHSAWYPLPVCCAETIKKAQAAAEELLVLPYPEAVKEHIISFRSQPVGTVAAAIHQAYTAAAADAIAAGGSPRLPRRRCPAARPAVAAAAGGASGVQPPAAAFLLAAAGEDAAASPAPVAAAGGGAGTQPPSALVLNGGSAALGAAAAAATMAAHAPDGGALGDGAHASSAASPVAMLGAAALLGGRSGGAASASQAVAGRGHPLFAASGSLVATATGVLTSQGQQQEVEVTSPDRGAVAGSSGINKAAAAVAATPPQPPAPQRTPVKAGGPRLWRRRWQSWMPPTHWTPWQRWRMFPTIS
jgi:hypothetical protein